MKVKRRIVSLLTVLCMVMSLIPQITVFADGEYSGGLGTEASPYLIKTDEDFVTLAEKVNETKGYENTYFLLDADDLTVTKPIAYDIYAFKGTFDGGNHTVTLDMEESDDVKYYLGLFGYNSGTIKNVKTTGAITGTTGGFSIVGGIVGKNTGTVLRCSNGAVISGFFEKIGGIVGYNSGIVQSCLNSAAVSGTTESDNNSYIIGGIVGYMENGGKIINCLNKGAVSGGSYIGGICGESYGEIKADVNDATVKALRSTGLAGGIIGKTGTNASTESCYFNKDKNEDITCIGSDSTDTRFDLTAENLVSEAVLSAFNDYAFKWDLGMYWKNDNGEIAFSEELPSDFSYPINNKASDYVEVAKSSLKGETVNITPKELDYMVVTSVTVSTDDGDVDVAKTDDGWSFTMPAAYVTVTAETDIKLSKNDDGEYLITSADDMKVLSNFVNLGCDTEGKTFILTNDVSVSTEDGFVPIGKSDTTIFKGTFDGGNHTVTLAIELSTTGSYLGLFGYNSGTIKNVKTTGTVKRSFSDHVGGIAGKNYGGRIENCSNSADIDAGSYVGGIVGDNAGGTIINCLNSGSVTGEYDLFSVGGISGDIDTGNGKQGVVRNCYNTGTITGGKNTGGIVGSGWYGELTNCVNNGSVKQADGSTYSVGGVCGTKGNLKGESLYFNSDLNSGIYDYGYTNNGKDECTDTDFAVSADEILSETMISKLNVYAKNNSFGTYWQVKDGVVSFADDVDGLPYSITNKSEYVTVYDTGIHGETVNITSNGVDYITITGVTVTDKDGKNVTVTETDDGWSFTMPKSDVTVDVQYKINEPEKDGDTYILKTASDFVVFAKMVNNGNGKINAKVVSDDVIDLTDYDIEIGEDIDNPYSGEFDGNGVTIKTSAELFGYAKKAVIQNMNMDIEFNSGDYTAGIVYEALKTKIVNCTVKGKAYVETFGGIAYEAINCVIANCAIYEVEMYDDRYLCYGGIAYRTENGTKIYNCANYDIFDGYINGGHDSSGMIVAYMSETEFKNNFFVGYDDGIFDVHYDNDEETPLYTLTDAKSKVSEIKAKNYYIQAKQNDFIRENPNIVDGITLKKWSESGYADEENPEVYGINQTDIEVKSLKWGMSVGEEVTFEVPKGAKVKVADAKGNEVECSSEENLYEFTMPAMNVNVAVTMDTGIDETKEIDGKTYVVVKTAADFVKAIKSIENGNTILNVYIAEDITVSNDDLNGFEINTEKLISDDGTYKGAYNGIFDGGDHTITFGDNVGSNVQMWAMIAVIGEDGVVKNLTVDGSITSKSEEDEESCAVGIAMINMGTIYNCVNKADISGDVVSGFVFINNGMIFNCINSGNIRAEAEEEAAVAAVINYGTVSFIINRGIVENAGDDIFIGYDYSDEEGENTDLSACDDEVTLKSCMAEMNYGIEMMKIYAQAYDNYEYFKAYSEVMKNCKMYSVKDNEVIFADKDNAAYYIFQTLEYNMTIYQAGETVEISIDESNIPSGATVSDVVRITKYFDGESINYDVDGNTVSFTMPANYCKIALVSAPSGLEKDDNGYYLVGSAEDLAEVKAVIEKGNTDINVKLTADIEEWTNGPIGGVYYKYNGIFDGNNHSITINVTGTDYADNYGLFGILDREAVVKNLTIKGEIKVKSSHLGSVAGTNKGTILNCVNNANLTTTYSSGCVGGIAGTNEAEPYVPDVMITSVKETFSGLIKDCTNNGILSGYRIGGIAENMYNNKEGTFTVEQPATIDNCVNNANLSENGSVIGGIVRSAGGDYNNYIVIKNCVNNGDIIGSTVEGKYYGGIVAYGNKLNVDNCVNNGNISGYYAGGIIECAGDIVIKNSVNNGNISGSKYSGGIMCNLENYDNYADIINCINKGNIAESSCSAGIIGYAEGTANIENCFNDGNVGGYSIAYFYMEDEEDNENKITNTYYLNGTADESSNIETGDNSVEVTSETVSSGEVSYKLNQGVSSGLNKWSVADGAVVFADDENGAVYKVSIDENIANGTVTADKEYVKVGESVKLTAVADSGYSLKEITGVEVDENNTFVMPEKDVTVSAVFEPEFEGTDKSDKIDLVQNIEMTKVDLSEYVKYVNAEVTGTFTFAVADGSKLPSGIELKDGVLSGTPTVSGSYSVVFDVTSDSVTTMSLNPEPAIEKAELTLTFDIVPTYKVSIDENIANGTVTADKEYVKVGENVTLTVKADSGYALKEITGVEVDENNTFVMPEKDVTVSAVFEKDSVIITKPNISGEESDDGKYIVRYVVPNGVKYYLICVEYTDGVMSKIKVVSSDEDTNNGELAVEKGKHTKIMLWSDLSKAKPLCGSYEVK